MTLPHGKNTCLLVMNDFSHDARVRRIVSSLREWSYGVTVIAEKTASTAEHEEWNGASIVRVTTGSTGLKKGRFAEYAMRALMVALKQRRSIYHAFDLDTLLPASIAARRHGSRLIYEAHEWYLGLDALLGRPVTRTVWKLLETILVKRIDCLVTINESIRQMYADRYGIQRTECVYNVPMRISPEASRNLRHELDIDPEKKIVVYIGILREGQGLFRALDIAAHLDEVVFVFIGDGPLKPALERRVHARGLNERVLFYGRVPPEKLMDVISSADAGLLLMEGRALNNYLALPNKLFTYIMAGVPAVVSDFPEMGGLVTQTGCGITIPEGCSSEHAAALIRAFLQDANRWSAAVENCRTAARTYNWEIEARKLKKVYAELEGRS